VVKETGSVVAMMALFAGGAAAQDVRSPQGAGSQSGEPRQAVAMPADAMRKQILNFNVLLRQAVQNGAETMTSKARQLVPQAALMLSGPPEVFGFRLENVGPVFEVRVPGMLPNYPWRVAMLGQPAVRRPVQPTNPSQTPRIEPTTLTQAGSTAANGADQPNGPRPPSPFGDVDFTVISDPDAAYTREVKNALIDAMLEVSNGLRVSANEFLTIVAHDSAQPDPLVPTSQTDFHTIQFQIKGSDLSDYHERKIPQDEAKRRIRITED
jgi:hypothetical protein